MVPPPASANPLPARTQSAEAVAPAALEEAADGHEGSSKLPAVKQQPIPQLPPSRTQLLPQHAQAHPTATATPPTAPMPTATRPTAPMPTQSSVLAPATALRKPTKVKRAPAAPLIIYPDTPVEEKERILALARAQLAADDAAHKAQEEAALKAHMEAQAASKREEEERTRAVAEACIGAKVEDKAALAQEEADEKKAKQERLRERLEAELVAVQSARAGVGAVMAPSAVPGFSKGATKAGEDEKVVRDTSVDEDESYQDSEAVSTCEENVLCRRPGRESATAEREGGGLQGHAAAEGREREGLPAHVLQHMSAMMVLGRAFEPQGPEPCFARAAR